MTNTRHWSVKVSMHGVDYKVECFRDCAEASSRFWWQVWTHCDCWVVTMTCEDNDLVQANRECRRELGRRER